MYNYYLDLKRKEEESKEKRKALMSEETKMKRKSN